MQKNISLEKEKHTENRVWRLKSTYGFEPDLIRRVQVATVKVVALYGVKI